MSVDVKIPQSIFKRIMKNHLLKDDINNREHVVNALMSGNMDTLPMAVSLAMSDNNFQVKHIGQLVKFKADRYDNGELYDVAQMKDMGLYVDGCIFGRVSKKNSSANDDTELYRPYSENLWVEPLICILNDGEEMEVKFAEEHHAKIVSNIETIPVKKDDIPFSKKVKNKNTNTTMSYGTD